MAGFFKFHGNLEFAVDNNDPVVANVVERVLEQFLQFPTHWGVEFVPGGPAPDDLGIYASDASTVVLKTNGNLNMAWGTDGTLVDYGQLIIQDGTSGAPGLAFDGDLTTGARRVTTGLGVAAAKAVELLTDSARGVAFSDWDSADTDIDGLLPGSQGGAIILAPSDLNLTIGLRENTAGDNFAIVSGGGNWGTDSTWDTAVLVAQADGEVVFNYGVNDGGLAIRPWTSNSTYHSIATRLMTGSEYMMLSLGTSTYISGGGTSITYIRAGSNSQTWQLGVATDRAFIGDSEEFTFDADGIRIDGQDPYTGQIAALWLDSPSTGGNYDDQVALIAVGESAGAYAGDAKVVINYEGDGYGYIGTGAITLGSAEIMAYPRIRMQYNALYWEQDASNLHWRNAPYNNTAGTLRMISGSAALGKLGQSMYSSRREYKRNIATWDWQKSRLRQLEPIRFRYRRNHPLSKRFDGWDEEADRWQGGFDFEQFQSVFPEFAHEGENRWEDNIVFEPIIPELVADYVSFSRWATEEIHSLKEKLNATTT